MENYSLSDIAAVNGADGFGGSGAWVLIILFALIFGNGSLFGNRTGDVASKEDVYNSVQRSTDFAAIERQLNEGVAATRQTGYDIMGTVKDSAYNNLSEIRDLEASVNAGFANSQKCCCETLRAIDSVNYNGAINTAAINANTTAAMQKIYDKLNEDKIETLQNQVNQLNLQAQLCNVVRYPVAAYPVPSPYGCGCGNI